MAPFVRALKKYKVHFFLDSAYYDHKVVEDVLEEAGFYYTVSVNKATAPLERLAEELPETQWQTIRGENGELRQVAELCYWPQGWAREHRYIAVRCRPRGEMFFYYSFILTNRQDLEPREVCELHNLKGEAENQQKNLLIDLGLHHPPMHSLNANRAYYTISALAHNLVVGIKHRYLPAECQQQRTHTIFHHIFQIPARVIKHARHVLVRLEESLMLPRLKEHLLTLTSRPGFYPLRS